MTDTAAVIERRIALAGASNFRDIGGYLTGDGRMTKWRRVFRADALHDLTPEDVQVIVALNLGDVFDLRTVKEIEVFGTNPLLAHGIRHHHVPFVPEVGMSQNQGAVPAVPAPDDHETQAAHYLDMLERSKPTLQRILTHLAEAPEQGAVFHCTGGRDRTGLTAALLLEVLGVTRDVIVADYALTTEYLRFPQARVEQMRALYGDRISPTGAPATHAEVMTLTLAGLDERYGSTRAYLEDAGVTADHQEALRRALLDAER